MKEKNTANSKDKPTAQPVGCACCCEQHANGSHAHNHSEEESSKGLIIRIAISTILLIVSVLLDFKLLSPDTPYRGIIILAVSLLAYIPIGYNVLREGLVLAFKNRDVFNELMLMSVATIAAFVIGEYHESVLLILLYSVGELLQDRASDKARKNIQTLIDIRPKTVTVITPNGTEEREARKCSVGDRLRFLPGERIGLDVTLMDSAGDFDYSSLTGESLPVHCKQGDEVMAGAIVLSKPIEGVVNKPFEDSTLSRIINMVENSAERKPDTERFIRRFARIYTPIVVALAVLLIFVPYFFGLYNGNAAPFRYYLYNGLVLLVASCPCALVISVPLSFFGGLGAASRNGLLFKGALFLDRLRHIDTFVFDKTGTLTEGVFRVSKALTHVDGINKESILSSVAALERDSSHPIAQAVVAYAQELQCSMTAPLSDIEEITGMGMKGVDDKGNEILVGNEKLLEKYRVAIHALPEESSSHILISCAGEHVMTLILSDKPKATARQTIKDLQERGYKTIMLSGDNKAVVASIGKELNVDVALGGLLPDDKIKEVEALRKQGKGIAFVGDGLNDAPVMSLSDVSFAMGGIGSDTTIEIADVVIQSDDPYRTVTAVDLSRYTYKIVLQNIIFALAVKVIVMGCAAFGVAELWWAILADVGVTLLAILNSLRTLHYR